MFPWNSQFFPSTTHYFPPSTLPRQFFGPEPGELAYCPGGWAGRDRWKTRAPGYGDRFTMFFCPFFCQIFVVILCNFGDRIVDLMFFFEIILFPWSLGGSDVFSPRVWWILWFFDPSWWWIFTPVQTWNEDAYLSRKKISFTRLTNSWEEIFTSITGWKSSHQGFSSGKLSLMPW